MALGITELNTVSKRYFDKTFTKQVYEASPFYAILKSKHKIILSGGTRIQWPIRYRKYGMADATNPRAQVMFESKGTRTAAVDDWKTYRVQTMMHWDEQLKNAGLGKIVDLEKDKAEEAAEDLVDILTTALYATSQGTHDLTPLSTIVDSGTTYGEIQVADASEWASQETTQTKLLLAGQYSLSYYRNLCTFGKRQPTHHFTTRDNATKYEFQLQPQQRYEDKETANLGFSNVTFYKKPVIGDDHCTTNYWYGLDIDAFELIVHEDWNFNTGKGWFSLEQAGFPQSIAKVCAWAGNLKCNMRKTSFKFTAMDYTK